MKYIFSFQNLLNAYYQCRKRKRKTINAAKFELNFEERLLKLEQELVNPELTNWFLVTSADQVKGQEANHLFESSSKFSQNDNYIIINKSWSEFIKNWEPENEKQKALKDNFSHQLNQIKKNISNFKIETIEFPEVFENQPSLQVRKLLETWEKI